MAPSPGAGSARVRANDTMPRVVGQGFLRAAVGMRVAMNAGYKSAGVGTVVSVQDESSCSVQWDSGRVEQCLLTGKHGMFQLVQHDSDKSAATSRLLDATALSMQSTPGRGDHGYDQLWSQASRGRSRKIEQPQSPHSPSSPRVLRVHLPGGVHGWTAHRPQSPGSPWSPRVLDVRGTGRQRSRDHSRVSDSPLGRMLFGSREGEPRGLREPSCTDPLPLATFAEQDQEGRWSALQAVIHELHPDRVLLKLPSLPDFKRSEHTWTGVDGQQHMVARSTTTLGIGVVGLNIDCVAPFAPASLAGGMAVGDEIVEVDGFSVSEKTLLTHILGTDTPDTFVSIMARRPDGSTYHMELLRGLRKHASYWEQIFRLLDSIASNEDAMSNSGHRTSPDPRIRQTIDTILGLVKTVKRYECAKEVQVRKCMNETYSVLCRSLTSAHVEIDRLQALSMSSEDRGRASHTAHQESIMLELHALHKNNAHLQQNSDSHAERLAAAEDRAKTAEQALGVMESKLDEAMDRLQAQRASALQDVADAQAQCEQVLRSLRASDEQLKAKEGEISRLKKQHSSQDGPERARSSQDPHVSTNMPPEAPDNNIQDADLMAENACLIAENSALLTQNSALKERLLQERLARKRVRCASRERTGPRGEDWDEEVDSLAGMQGDAWREREQIISREQVTSLIRERDRLRSQVERLESENEEWQQELNTMLARLQIAATKSDANVQSLLENEIAKSQALEAETLQQEAVIDKQRIALDATYRQLQATYVQLRQMEQVKEVPKSQKNDEQSAMLLPSVIPLSPELLSWQSQQPQHLMNQLQHQQLEEAYKELQEQTRQMHQHMQQQQQRKAMAEHALMQLQASHSHLQHQLQQQQQQTAMAEQAVMQLKASHSHTQLQDQQTMDRLQDELNKLQQRVQEMTEKQSQLDSANDELQETAGETQTKPSSSPPQQDSTPSNTQMFEAMKARIDALEQQQQERSTAPAPEPSVRQNISLVREESLESTNVVSGTTKEDLKERIRDLETEQLQLLQRARSLTPQTQGRATSEPLDTNTSVMSHTREEPANGAMRHARETPPDCYTSVMSCTREALKERIAELEPLTHVVAGMEEMQTHVSELELLLTRRTEELQGVRNKLNQNIEAFQISSAYIRELELRLYGNNAPKQGEVEAVQEKRVAFLQAEAAQLRLALEARQQHAQVSATGESSWERPETAAVHPALPEGWTAVWNGENKRYYYANSATGETTWEKPAAVNVEANGTQQQLEKDKAADLSAPISDLPAPTRSVTALLENATLDAMKVRVAQLEDERAAIESKAQDHIAELVQRLTAIEKANGKIKTQLELEVKAKSALQEQVSELQLVLSESRRRSHSASRESRNSAGTPRFAGDTSTLKAENESLKGQVAEQKDENRRLLNALMNLQSFNSGQTPLAPGSGAPFEVVTSIDPVGKRMSQDRESNDKANHMKVESRFVSENAAPPPTAPRSPLVPRIAAQKMSMGTTSRPTSPGHVSSVSGSTEDNDDELEQLRRHVVELVVARSEQAVEEMQNRAQIAEMEQVIQDLQAQASSRKSAVQDEYKVIIASLHQRIEDLNSKLGTHMSHGRDSAVEDKGREAASAQREALELERFVRQLQDVVKAKQAQIEGLERRLSCETYGGEGGEACQVGKHDAENRGEGMEEQALEIISKLQKGHAKYRSVIADLESKLMQVAQQLLHMESANSELVHHNHELRDEKDALQSQVTELQDALKTKAESACSVATEGDESREDGRTKQALDVTSKLESNQIKHRAAVAEFESKLVQVAKELNALETANSDLTRENQVLRDERADLQSQVAELEVKVSALVKESNQLRSMLGQAEVVVLNSSHDLARKVPEDAIQQGVAGMSIKRLAPHGAQRKAPTKAVHDAIDPFPLVSADGDAVFDQGRARARRTEVIPEQEPDLESLGSQGCALKSRTQRQPSVIPRSPAQVPHLAHVPQLASARHSFDPENFQAEPTAGFGIEFETAGLNDSGPQLVVQSILPGGAADADGSVQAGDRLIAVDGVSVCSLSEEQLIQAVQGPVGSVARLLFIPAGVSADSLVEGAYEVILTRRPVGSDFVNQPPVAKQPQPPQRSPAAKLLSLATPKRGRPPLLQGQTAGVGLLLVQESQGDDIFVKDIVADGAAALDGRISVGDHILSIDGESLLGLDLHSVWDRMRGADGSVITFEIRKPVQDHEMSRASPPTITVQLTRKNLLQTPRASLDEISLASKSNMRDWALSRPSTRALMPSTLTTGKFSLSPSDEAFLGLFVYTDALPHAVSQVRGLMDINMVRQGQPGYTNEEVRTGDLILKIDGRDVRNVSSHALQILLKGRLHTPVKLTLCRAKDATVYHITVMRHASRQYDPVPEP